MPLDRICKVLANLHQDILMAAVIDGEDAIDVYLKPNVPFPRKQSWKQAILEIQIMTALARNTRNFLGAFDHMVLHHEFGDALVFPLGSEKVLFVVTTPAADRELASLIRQNLMIVTKE